MKRAVWGLAAIMPVLLALAQSVEQYSQWAVRVRCEIQTAAMASLPKLTVQQGTTPLFSFDQYRSGRAMNADSNAVARLVFGASATAQYYVVASNFLVDGNSFYVQCPTIGTNTAGKTWWYTIYFERDGYRYWTGNGQMEIVATTSTADGLVWQNIVAADAGVTEEEMQQYVTDRLAALPPESDPIAMPRVEELEANTNNWNTAYERGDHNVQGYLRADATNGLLKVEVDPVAIPVIHAHTSNAAIHLTAQQTQQIAEAANTSKVAQVALTLADATNTLATIASEYVRSVNGQTGVVTVVTEETDLAALRAYHYGSPDIIESPAEWFVFDGVGTITAFNWEVGRENVVIPWAIGGVPVTAIGENAFLMSAIVSVIAPQTVTSIEESAFANCISLTSVSLPQAQTVGAGAFVACESLTSVSLPQAQTIGAGAFVACDSLASISLPQVQTVGDSAFGDCPLLASVSLPQVQTVGNSAFGFCTSLASVYFDNDAPTIGADIFAGITPNQVTNYVTNPQATGWGATIGDMPVVRPPLYADAIYQAGELVATTGHVAQAIAAIPVPDMSDHPTFAQIAASNALPYTAWTGTVTPADGTATVAVAHGNMPVLVTTAPCVLTLDPTGYGTGGVSRVSLSVYTGGETFTLATNVITYATAPTIATNDWNTILIRRVGNGTWKGVGL